MKTTQIMKGAMLLFLMLISVVTLIAQAVDPVTDVVDLAVRFDVLIGSLGGYAVISIFITGLFNGWSKITKSWMKQAISWVVPFVLVFLVTYLLKAGFLAGEGFIKVLVFGVAAGLVSNGIFDIAFVNTMVNWAVEKLGGVVKKE